MEGATFKFAVAAILISCVASHYVHKTSRYLPQTKTDNKVIPASCENARLISYHIHVLFWPYHQKHVEGALKLQQKFIKHFNLENINCTITAGDPGLPDQQMCVFEIDWEPLGPFTTAQYSFFIPPEKYVETVTYILQNRGIYDVLVHPNSGCETYDHSRWAVWSGHQWPIDASVFSCDYPGCITPN